MGADLDGLYRLDKPDVKQAAEMLARAFHDDPLTLLAFPDGVQDDEVLFNFFLVPMKYCLKYGEVYAPSPEIEGAALWLPSNRSPITFWRMLRTSSLWSMLKMTCKMGVGKLRKMSRVGGFLDKAHKRLAPFEHYYLQTLGVDPSHQGKSYASKLLRPMLARLDEQGMPCYLDTMLEKNAEMYQHFGFEVVEKMEIPDIDITVWAMLREPG